MTAPVISVVIATYERWPLVAEAVDSALAAADGIDAEVVVVDDGSTDGTVERLSHRDSRLRVLGREHAGRSAARNAGAAAATGGWLAFLDSDDLMEPWHLADALAATRSGADVYSAQVTFWDPATGRLRANRPPAYLPVDLRLAAAAGMVLPLPGLVVSRSAFERAGGFPESQVGSEDWVLLARLLRFARVEHLARRAVRVREHADRSMADVDWDVEWRERATELLLGDDDLTPEECTLVRAGTDRYCAARLYEVGRYREAWERLGRVRAALGPRAGLRWTGRLTVQTALGPLLGPARVARRRLGR